MAIEEMAFRAVCSDAVEAKREAMYAQLCVEEEELHPEIEGDTGICHHKFTVWHKR